jgi:hypothetical protein
MWLVFLAVAKHLNDLTELLFINLFMCWSQHPVASYSQHEYKQQQ